MHEQTHEQAPTLSLSAVDVSTIYRSLMSYPCAGDEAIRVASLILRLRQLPPPPAPPALEPEAPKAAGAPPAPRKARAKK